MADSLNAHRESNETNNALALNLTVAAPAPDSDSDGLDDLSEAAAGTDSTNAASVLEILAALAQVGWYASVSVRRAGK